MFSGDPQWQRHGRSGGSRRRSLVVNAEFVGSSPNVAMQSARRPLLSGEDRSLHQVDNLHYVN